MTKEELEKEVEEKAETYSEAFIEKGVAKASYAKGYLAGAEPREKRIAELEAQIEKMKCCGNCKHQCSFLFQDEIDCENNGLPKWEIKEND